MSLLAELQRKRKVVATIEVTSESFNAAYKDKQVDHDCIVISSFIKDV
jgi:hypothetical protein